MQLGAVGDYVRVKSSGVTLRIESPESGEFLDLSEGDSVELSPFKTLNLSHSDASDQSVILLIGNRTKSQSQQSVVMNPVRSGAASVHADSTVTTASGTLRAASATRRYLFIQNKHATGNIWINLNGATATTANGIKIPPGGFYETGPGWVCTAAVTAIGDVASNTSVLVVEGGA